MNPVVLAMIVSMALAVGCGEAQTDQQAKVDGGDDIASIEMKTTFRGKKVGKNLKSSTVDEIDVMESKRCKKDPRLAFDGLSLISESYIDNNVATAPARKANMNA